MLGFDALAKLPLAALPDDLGQTLSPSLFVDADTFHSPTVSPGEVTLSPALYSDPDTFYGPTIVQVVLPNLFTDADTFHSPQVNLTIFPALYEDADTFHSPTILPGEVTLLPSLFEDGDTFYSPTLTISVHPPLFVDQDIFYSPFVGLGTPPIPYPANICQTSGFKVPPRKLARQWNGIVARREDFDERHPQEFVRPVRDRIRVSRPRPEPVDRFLLPGEVDYSGESNLLTLRVTVGGDQREDVGEQLRRVV